MKPYFSLLRVRFLNGLQYRLAAFSGMTTQVAWGLMLVFIYSAFFGDAAVSDGFTFKQLVTFVWLQQAALTLIFIYDYDGELLEMITTGGIGYELCRPVNIYYVWYAKLVSKRTATACLRFFPVIIVAFLIPYPFRLSLPYSPLAFCLFVVTLFIGLLLVVSINMMVYISNFKTLSPGGSIAFISIIGEFFGGQTIPIPLMPGWLQEVSAFLPFRWVADLPFRVYSGHIGTKEALTGLAMQLIWLTILISAGMLIMRRVARLSMVQGG